MRLDILQLHLLRLLVTTCDVDVLRDNLEDDGVECSNEQLRSMLLTLRDELEAEACGE